MYVGKPSPKSQVVNNMGVCPVTCPKCAKVHFWFSGSPDQRCEECRMNQAIKLCDMLDEARKKATPGEWEAEEGVYPTRWGTTNAVGGSNCVYNKRDAELIALSANHITQLTAALRAAAQALEEYRAMGTLFKYPEEWNSFKEGGAPQISDYEEINAGEIAANALDQVNALCEVGTK